MDSKSETPSNAAMDRNGSGSGPDRAWWFVFIAIAAFLSMFTVYYHVFIRVGEKFIWDEQLRFQRWVIEGTSYDPWQYRILVPYMVEGIREIIMGLRYEASYLKVFFGVRLLQDFMIFLVAALYLRRFSIRRSHIALALAILAWGFTYSGFESHLAFDTYFDILFYLLAAYLLLGGKLVWIIPLSILVAFNRETGLLIPLIVLVAGTQFRPRFRIERKHAIVGFTSLALMAVIIVSIRMVYGPRPYLHITVPGWDLFVRNVTSFHTYFYLFATYSVVPAIALARYKQWPPFLVRVFWLVVPVWILIHLFTGVLSEARLLLVPYTLVILPGALVRRPQNHAGEMSAIGSQ